MGKHPGGRPTKYRPELCQDIIDFFGRDYYIEKKVKNYDKDGKPYEVVDKVPNESPYLIDWVMKHNLAHDTPLNWTKKYPEFFDAYKRAKSLQEKFFVELGIKGDHNGFITFQTLKNISGWRDKHEVKSEQVVSVKNEVTIKYEEMPKDRLTDYILARSDGQSASKLN